MPALVTRVDQWGGRQCVPFGVALLPLGGAVDQSPLVRASATVRGDTRIASRHTHCLHARISTT